MKPLVQDWNDPAVVAAWLTQHSAGNPGRREQLDLVLTLLAQVQPRGLRVLDLGCGDGLVAELILNRLPESYVAGVDMSEPMMQAASVRLAAYPGRYALHRRGLEETAPLMTKSAPFDAAIGIQSIHHLAGPGKRRLFAWVALHLRPGGLFVLSDRVRLPSAALFPYYQALYNARQARYGQPPLPVGYGYAAHRRSLALRADLPDTVDDQVAWLREAGFGEADCFYRDLERAIFGGLKQEPGLPDDPDPVDMSAALITTANSANGVL